MPARFTTTPINTKKKVRTRKESSEWNVRIFSWCSSVGASSPKVVSTRRRSIPGKLAKVSPKPSTAISPAAPSACAPA